MLCCPMQLMIWSPQWAEHWILSIIKFKTAHLVPQCDLETMLAQKTVLLHISVACKNHPETSSRVNKANLCIVHNIISQNILYSITYLFTVTKTVPQPFPLILGNAEHSHSSCIVYSKCLLQGLSVLRKRVTKWHLDYIYFCHRSLMQELATHLTSFKQELKSKADTVPRQAWENATTWTRIACSLQDQFIYMTTVRLWFYVIFHICHRLQSRVGCLVLSLHLFMSECVCLF